MKLIITGYSQHGKDKICEIIESIYGLKSISSSFYAVNYTDAFDGLLKKTSMTRQELHLNRDKYRKEFFEAIAAYNEKYGMSALGRGIFSNHTIYNGIRNDVEFFALKEEKVFDFSIWVDASKRKPKEHESSCKMKMEYCDYILDNNGSIPNTAKNILIMMDSLSIKTNNQNLSSMRNDNII